VQATEKENILHTADLCLALSLTALILTLPANLLPFMQLEFYGQARSSTIWQGIVSLSESGEWFVAFVIFFASLIIPLLKIAALIFLSVRLRQGSEFTPRELYVHRAIEVLGRWSMLDIFLVAILVAMLKFGAMAHAEIRAGAVFFLLTIIASMVVSELLSRAIRRSA